MVPRMRCCSLSRILEWFNELNVDMPESGSPSWAKKTKSCDLTAPLLSIHFTKILSYILFSILYKILRLNSIFL